MSDGARRQLSTDVVIRQRSRLHKATYARRPILRTSPRLLNDVIAVQRTTSAPLANVTSRLNSPQFSDQQTTTLRNANEVNAKDLVKAGKLKSNLPIINKVPEEKAETIGFTKTKKSKRSKVQIALTTLAIILFASGMYTSFMEIRAEHYIRAQAAQLTKQANEPGKNSVGSTALSTVKPTTLALDDYVVAPNFPRYLKIPVLGVDARVLSVGVNASGALGTPDNVYDTAWYNESAEPGQPGAVLIDGHISSWTSKGVFYGLKDLKPGDSIQITRGDGTIFNYEVVETKIYSSNSVNMAAAISPIVPGVPGLNLISCSGDVIAGTSQFNERIIVFAKQVSP